MRHNFKQLFELLPLCLGSILNRVVMIVLEDGWLAVALSRFAQLGLLAGNLRDWL